MSTFLKNRWKYIITVLVVLAVLTVAYIFVFARPATDHYNDDKGGTTIPRHELNIDV